MIAILRLGHRPDRDKRITTHVGLVARAFGADSLYITTKDHHLKKSLDDVCTRFGGSFDVTVGVKGKQLIKSWKGTIVHLTMYGAHLDQSITQIPKKNNLLIIIGAEKVPPYYYQIADYNISIGNQPHSEVAALAIFLDRYTNNQWINKKFDGDLTISPSTHRKIVTPKKK